MKASRSFRDVIALIEAAFTDVGRDEDCTLHQAQLADQSMSREISQEEWDAEKLRDPETDWREVPAESLDECSAALSHASPQSWLFYIPAYMRRALELWDEWHSQGASGALKSYWSLPPEKRQQSLIIIP